MLNSLLRFLSLRLDECTGNGELGVMGCTATAGRLCLRPLGLESVFGRRLLLATAAAGKSLPNVEELAGAYSYPHAHSFRVFILSGIARGARSLSTKVRSIASRALTAVLSL